MTRESIRLVNSSNPAGKEEFQRIYDFASKAADQNLASVHDIEMPCPRVLICECLSACREAYVAEVSEDIVGVVTLAFNGTRGGVMPTLEGLYVLPAYRNRGIGRKLVIAALERFDELRKKPIHCEVASESMESLLGKLKESDPAITKDLILVRGN